MWLGPGRWWSLKGCNGSPNIDNQTGMRAKIVPLVPTLFAVALVAACGNSDTPATFTASPSSPATDTASATETLVASSSTSETAGEATSAAAPASQAPASASSAAAISSEAPSSTAQPAPAPEAGRIHLTGTVRSISAEEALNGYSAYEGIGWNQRYTVFDLDTPTEVRGVIPGNQNSTQTLSRVVLAGDWDGYIGQHITVSAPGGEFRFPGGTDLPIGTPRVKGARVV